MLLTESVLEKQPMDFMERLDIEADFDRSVGMTTRTFEEYLVGFEAYKRHSLERENLVRSILSKSLGGMELNGGEIKELVAYNLVLWTISSEGMDEEDLWDEE